MKKLRIAIYYSVSFGRNDGAPLYYFNQLQKLKDVDVVHLIPEGDTSDFGKFDLHFWVDWGEDGLPVDHNWMPPKDGGKTIYIVSDTHIAKEGKEYRFNRARKFDYVFFNQSRACNEFGSKKNTFWLPHAVEPQAYPKFDIIKKYDVAFIGHLQEVENYNKMNRVEALDKLFNAFPNFYFGTRNSGYPEKNMFEHAAKEFSKSKIIFNISITDDINMRVFESMATGSMLLTNELPTLSAFFKDKKHLVTYDSYKDMIEKVQYYIDNDEEREKIALAGYTEVIKHHTYQMRIQEIFNLLHVDYKFK